MTLNALNTAGTDPADAAHVALHDEEDAARRIAAARKLLSGDGVSPAFFDALFAGAPPEDVARYTPASLAALAALAFDHSAARPADQSHIEILSFRAESDAGTRNENVLIAVNEDMPFLFDSMIGELAAQGVRVHALFHPIVSTTRDASGKRSGTGTAVRESVIVLVLDALIEGERAAALIAGAQNVFSQVRYAVRDWKQMQTHLKEAIVALKSHPPQDNAEELAESIAFLEWMGDNHFTFLGARDYSYNDADGGKLEPIDGSGLGVLGHADARVIRRGEDRSTLTPEVRNFLNQPTPLIITKSNERSVIHRRVHMDYVGVKLFSKDGRLIGERRFVGLFTSGAYSRRPGEIPLLRLKVRHVTERAHLAPNSHDGKALAHILDTYPRDELFQVNEDELFATAIGILQLGERPKVRVFLRFDRFDRFVSALVFVPRDRYDTHSRERIHAILAKAFNGRMSAANPTLDDSLLARVHFIVGRNEGPRPHVDVHALEAQIRDAIRTWDDGFATALMLQHGDADGQRLFHRHASGFPARYRDAFPPDVAVKDLAELEALARSGFEPAIQARAYRRARDAHNALRLKLYVLGPVLPLSASLPVFENLGFKVIAEDSYPIQLETSDGWNGEAAVLDFLMERADDGPADLSEIKAPLEDAFQAIVSGAAESDGLNKLVVAAGIDWRDVTILRTAAKFLRQAGFSFSQDYIEQALFRNPDIAQLLIELFDASHNPSHTRAPEAVKSIHARIDTALNDVPSLDDDRIIRRLRNVIDCTLRTNFYQPDRNGQPKRYVAFKLDSQGLDELPAPRPLVEIFVYSPEVEGDHLRFGRIARGGIRWSDRREDFRTEVLGLVKAQQVKNAVIVPVGSKGGFYPKMLPTNATREDVQAAGISAYKTFINALLDLTDNIAPDGSIVHPENVVRHDGDDPYLVVAA
ncbi:MAG TPA: NAD-glutamate dehydrogenase domain-containing protein, partial [Rhizomicrobium sp.]|nr:NAD-glutamate dehydrogenase domain-containing protein [Rhizomicrobium sp.]